MRQSVYEWRAHKSIWHLPLCCCYPVDSVSSGWCSWESFLVQHFLHSLKRFYISSISLSCQWYQSRACAAQGKEQSRFFALRLRLSKLLHCSCGNPVASLFIVHCSCGNPVASLFIVHCSCGNPVASLFIVHCSCGSPVASLFIVHVATQLLHCSLFIVHVATQLLHCSLFIVHVAAQLLHCSCGKTQGCHAEKGGRAAAAVSNVFGLLLKACNSFQ